MIQFEELKMANDRGSLSISCSVTEDYEQYAYIKKVDVVYYTEAATYASTTKKLNLYTGTDTAKKSHEETVYAARLQSALDISTLENGMFFVIVTTEVSSTPPQSLPCGEDRLEYIGIILDWKTVYARGMQYISALLADCSPCPAYDKYEGFILNWYGLRLAIATCDIVAAAAMWERFLRTEARSGSTVKATGCGCGS